MTRLPGLDVMISGASAERTRKQEAVMRYYRAMTDARTAELMRIHGDRLAGVTDYGVPVLWRDSPIPIVGRKK